MNPIDFAGAYLYPFKIKGDEIIADRCPICHGGQHRDKGTFALNMENLTFNCKRGSCSARGTFNELCKMFGGESDADVEWRNNYVPKPKVFIKPKVKTEPVQDAIRKYFEGRGISKETYQRRRVGQTEKGAIMFPFFENGELVLVKYRTIDKKMWRTTDSKSVFWGLDECDPAKPLIIVEGEIDALTLDECGVPNVVSVPSGASDLDCIQYGWEKLQLFEKIIIWNDADDPGVEMRNNIIKRLGEDRVHYVECDMKDTNEFLMARGKEAVLQQLENIKPAFVEDVLKAADVPEYDPGAVESLKTSINNIDSQVGGLPMGHVSIISGKRSSGKSTFINTLIAQAIQQGFKAFVFSGELEAGLVRYWIERTLAGPDAIFIKKEQGTSDKYFVSEDHKKLMRHWYRDSFFLYDNNQRAETSKMAKRIETTFKRYGVRFFVLDNIMTLDFGIAKEVERLQKQSDFVEECVMLARKYNIHIAIVQHPIKKVDRITIDDIKGTGDITNRASLTFIIHRIKEKEKAENEIEYDAVIEVAKNRLNGREFDTELFFNLPSMRFFEHGRELKFKYSWTSIAPWDVR